MLSSEALHCFEEQSLSDQALAEDVPDAFRVAAVLAGDDVDLNPAPFGRG